MYQSLRKTYTVGDLSPDLAGTLNYSIAGHTLTLAIKRPDASLLVKTAVIDSDGSDGENAVFRFVWQAGELQAGLRQICQFFDTDASARRLSSPKFFLNVITPEVDE